MNIKQFFVKTETIDEIDFTLWLAEEPKVCSKCKSSYQPFYGQFRGYVFTCNGCIQSSLGS